jgi:hypothetical protein
VHLTKEPRYFSAIDEIREQYTPRSVDQASIDAKAGLMRGTAGRKDVGGVERMRSATILNPLGKLPGSVWEIATQPLKVPAELGVDHFAAFPMEWPRRLIQGWSPPGGIVLDPFGGTGTTALVATTLGRHGISVDLSADYCRLAEWRTTDPVERARAAGTDTTKVTRTAPGQSDLFGDAA